LGFVLMWYALFLLTYGTVTGLGNPRPVVRDRLAAAAIHGGAILVGIALVSTVVFTFWRGLASLWHPSMVVHDVYRVGQQAPPSQGGVAHAIVGTLIELAIGVFVSLPVGVATAVFMTEVGGWFARIVRTVIEAMTALPDILAGLFVYV